MKTVKINNTEIEVSHEIKSTEAHDTHIHCKFESEGKSIVHVLTVGAVDQPLPVGYDRAALQKDIDEFKSKHAALFESKIRAAKLAASLE